MGHRYVEVLLPMWKQILSHVPRSELVMRKARYIEQTGITFYLT